MSRNVGSELILARRVIKVDVDFSSKELLHCDGDDASYTTLYLT